ncbi:EutP/PduV family microcompartment system protein [Clostridium bowmanii]|uniref:EutP/PduV family microcompartment system protein n=1 Tax=Clostridium bowmanii TaxID=132925 RepID=UPI001C0DC7AF|nr:EutP/PduV family microcompartment system protein [Clostridium bowmanii]MBU3191154.1 EutP/PduV family microcompartment system protein [Clostridium bowmanii]MCA1075545.1 EutP/PduV family microcompartment system protein [Clostridium bowmanii]
MKKMMLVGAIDSGKTTLIMALNGQTGVPSKTQTLKYSSFMIDTPGEYMENPRMYTAIMSTAQEAKLILFTQDASSEKSIFPPGFARSFSGTTIGIVTKIDFPNSNIENSVKILNKLGLKGPVFEVSSITGEGIESLKSYINSALNKSL